MVIAFDSIPLHLQTRIVEKTSFMDFVTFELSSKHGRDVIKTVTKPVTMEVKEIVIELSNIFIDFRKRNRNRTHFGRSHRKAEENYPLFSAGLVSCDETLTVEMAAEIIKDAEDGFITGQEALLTLYSVEMTSSVFSRFLEVLKISKIRCVKLDPEFLKLPVVQKLEQCHILETSVNPEDILTLRGNDLNFCCNGPTVISILNHFIRQWHQRTRTIHAFYLNILDRANFTEDDFEKIFAELPKTLVWSDETFDCKQFIYSLEDGTRTLVVEIRGGTVTMVDRTDSPWANSENVGPC